MKCPEAEEIELGSIIKGHVEKLEEDPSSIICIMEELERAYPWESSLLKRGIVSMVEKMTEREREKMHGARICGEQFEKGDIVWSCLTCEVNKQACYCDSCYIGSLHIDHNSFYTLIDYGCCDCGDPNYLTPSSFCPTHDLSHLSTPQFISPLLYQTANTLIQIIGEKIFAHSVGVKVKDPHCVCKRRVFQGMEVLKEIYDCCPLLGEKYHK